MMTDDGWFALYIQISLSFRLQHELSFVIHVGEKIAFGDICIGIGIVGALWAIAPPTLKVLGLSS